MLKRITKLFILLLLSTLFSCSTTKSLEEGDVFYKGSRIHISKTEKEAEWKIENSSEKFSTLYYNLWDAPNGGIFGTTFGVFFPARLYIYNWFYNTKDRGFNNWMRINFGEPPITIQRINPDIKTQKGVSIFENYGHFGTTGHYKLNYNKRQNKAYLHYYFDIPKAYIYRNVTLSTSSSESQLFDHINEFAKKTKLKPGREFNLYTIREENKNLETHLNNNGYFFIHKNDFIISADTTVGKKQVNLEIALTENLPPICYQKQMLLPSSVFFDSVMQKNGSGKKYTWGYGRLKKHVLDSVVKIKSGHAYSLENTRTTERNLNSLGIFSNPRILYKVWSNDSLSLKPELRLNMLDATKITFNLRGNYKNTGYVGPSAGFTFKQLNVFGGAENLTVVGDAYYDFPIGLFRDRISVSSGFSFRNTLSAPLFKTPKNILKHAYVIPKYFVSLNYDYNRRKDYFDIINVNTNYGWAWSSNKRLSHKLFLVNATYSNISNTTARFDSLTTDNPFLRESLIDQFILGTAYEINYSKPAFQQNKLGIDYNARFDLAGNLLNLLNSSFTNRPQGEQKFLGVPFSQFARVNSRVVLNWNFSKKAQLVFRNITGVGLAYGNSQQLPYIENFFIGGSNSLRPFPIRAIGPGRFIQLDEGEVNQAGEFKIEFNLEYRFTLFWKLKFAFFADAGNIWLLNPDPSRPGGEVRWNKLMQDSYLTSGAGLRLETDYIVLRLDLGVVLYWPIFSDDQRWIFQLPSEVVKSSFAPVFAIGYPF